MAELYLMSAEAWNEYLDVPDDEHVYSKIDVVRERAGIPKVREAWGELCTKPPESDHTGRNAQHHSPRVEHRICLRG